MGRLGSKLRKKLKLSKVEDDTYPHFEEIIQNPGLHIIAIKIFSFLDFDDLATCRLVCRGANDLIKHQRLWLTSVLKMLLHSPKTFYGDTLKNMVKKSIIESFPWWQNYFEYIVTHAKWRIMELIILMLQNYLRAAFTSTNSTPLHWTIQRTQDHSNLTLIEFFLDSPLKFIEDFFDVDVSEDDEQIQRNPFAIACGKGFVKIAKLLQKYAKKQSIQLNEVSMFGNAFHSACFWAHMDSLKFLLPIKEEIGLDVNSISHEFGTPLHAVLSMNENRIEDWMRMEERPKIVTFILENREKYGFNVNLRNRYGITPLELAEEFDFPEIVEIFKQHGFE